MQNATWIALIGRFSPDQHANLILVTANGVELAIQAILRVEEDYLVTRARMSGTDISRTLFVPYATIAYMGFLKPVKEALVHAMFGDTGPAPPEPKTEPEAPTTDPSSAIPPVEESTAAQPAAPPAAENEKPNGTPVPAAPTLPPDKKTMLERLRSRSFVGTSKVPPNR